MMCLWMDGYDDLWTYRALGVPYTLCHRRDGRCEGIQTKKSCDCSKVRLWYDSISLLVIDWCCLLTLSRTMQTLQVERVKREKELEMLRSSEPKLIREIAGLKETMGRMQAEMKVNAHV